MKILLIGCFIVLSFFSNAQGVEFQWAKSLGTTVGIKDTELDSIGNIYVTGVFNGIVDFDPSAANTYTLNGAADIFLSKFDNLGNFIWAKSFGGRGMDSGNSLTIDMFGNVYMTGCFQDTVNFNPTSTVNILIADSLEDVFILKFNSNGNFLWVKSIGGAFEDIGVGIKTDLFGNVYTSGTFKGTVDFDVSTNTLYLTSGTLNGVDYGIDIFVLKMDSSGQFTWAKNIGGGNSTCNVTGIDLDIVGNIFLTGAFYGTPDFDPGSGTATQTVTVLTGGYVTFISKWDNAGNFNWVKTLRTEESNSILLDSYSNVYTTGSFTDNTDFNPNAGSDYMTSSPGYKNIYMLKLDSSGNFMWAKMLGNAISSGSGTDITKDQIGNIYVAGYFGGNPGLGLVSQGGYDAFVAKLNSQGNFIWAKGIGGIGGDYANTVSVDKTGSVFYGGSYSVYYSPQNIDFDPGLGVYTLSDGGAFLSKIGPCNGVPAPLTNVTLNNQLYCPNGSYTLSAISSDVVNWYATGTTTTVLSSGSDFVTPILNSGTHTYYAEVNTCTLSLNRVAITMNVVSSPTLAVSNLNICAGQSSTLSVIGANTCTWTTGIHSNSIVVTPTSTSSYSVISEFAGCKDTLNSVIVVHPYQIISITAIDSLICSGNRATLIAVNSSLIDWFDSFNSNISLGSGNTFLTPTLSVGSYTYYAETYSNCNGSPNSRIAVTLTVVPTPTVSISTGTICIGSAYSLTPNGANTYTYSSVTPIVSPSVTTSYIVIGENIIGNCRDTVSVTITVNPNPIISVSNATICAGQPINTSSSGAQTYTITNGGLPTNVSASYTVTGTDVNGCVDSVGVISQVTVLPLPTITVNSNTSICIFSTDTIHLSGALYYNMSPVTSTFFFGTYYTVRPTMPTDYVILGQDSFGCQNTTTLTVTVDSTCTYVWPGDANSDGVVDNLDVLDLGLNYAQGGPARSLVSNNWQAYNATSWANWPVNFSYIRNLCTSDCNGDGIINDDDTLAIFNNYNFTHVFKPAQTTTNPLLSIVPDQSHVDKGLWGTASIYLGNATTTIYGVNGVAFTVNFDNTLIETNSVYIEYQNSFIDAGQNLHFRKLDFTNGKIYTATTHTINGNVNGYGKIATLHYKIKSTLSSDQLLNIGLSNANQSNVNNMIFPLTSGSATLMAIGASVGINELTDGNCFSILPNPANDVLVLELKMTNEINATIEITNTIGQVVLSSSLKNNKEILNITQLSNGVYFVKVLSTNKQVGFKKIVVQR